MNTTTGTELPPVQNQNEVILSSVSETEAELRQTLGLPPVDAPSGPDPVTPPADPEVKEKSGVELRINQLTRERYEEKARADQLAEELARIKAIAPEAPPSTPQAAPAAPAVDATPPEPTRAKPVEDDFPTFTEYMEALTDWKLEQTTVQTEARVMKRLEAEREAAARQQWEAQRARDLSAAEAAYHERIAKAKEQYADYNDVLETAKSLPVTPEIQLVIQNSPVGVDLGYHLMKNPGELDRINRLPPAAQFIELGKLEALQERGLLSASAPPATGQPAPSVRPPAGGPQRPMASRAPAPPPRVNPGAVVPQKNPEDMSYAEYSAWRQAGGGR